MKKIIPFCATLLCLFAAASAFTAELSVFGEKTFVRTASAPDVYTESFAAWPAAGTLLVRNGSESVQSGESDRVSSARIVLNGIEIAGPAEINLHEYVLERPVTLLEENTLVIELSGMPDSFLTVAFVQDLLFDLAASGFSLDTASCPDSLLLTVRVTNSGEQFIPSGLNIGFYAGDPALNGERIGSAVTGARLEPGEYENITFAWSDPPADPGTVFVRIDDDDIYEEIDEGNNVLALAFEPCLPLPTAVLTAEPLTIAAGEAVHLAWSTTDADTVTIDNGIGTVDLNGSMDVFPAATTTYTLTASGPGGTISTAATVTVSNPISLTITSPAEGEITGADILVTGTVMHADNLETGVVVNGRVALVHGDMFAANAVPLDDETGTITVVATDVLGRRVEQTMLLTVQEEPRRIELAAVIESGLAPMETAIRIDSNFTVAEAGLTGTGPGTIEFLSVAEDTYTVRIAEPGLYIFTATATDELGGSYTSSLAILAMDRTVLDALLQAKWNGMKEALRSGLVDAATEYFHPVSRSAYQAQYEALLPVLSQFVDDMGEFRLVEHDGYGAIYDLRTIRNNVELSFQVLFVQDAEGIWRIMNF